MFKTKFNFTARINNIYLAETHKFIKKGIELMEKKFVVDWWRLNTCNLRNNCLLIIIYGEGTRK